MQTIPSHDRLFNRVSRGLPVAAAVMLTLMLAGRVRAASAREFQLFAAHAPMPQIVARGAEFSAAEMAAEAQHGCFAVRGEGCSMEPVYLPGTALVVRVATFNRLRPGAVAVYKNTRGVVVAHMLVRQKLGGWVAVGLNNEHSDSELVTADNFIGEVTQAFTSRTGSLPGVITARMALNDQLRRGRKLASAGI